ncbi:MAG: putative Ig domain-containing protein [Ignavibacteriae bacterium]|nr:putative Ig domain-containing protein [Ignavibacteriota bacterium]
MKKVIFTLCILIIACVSNSQPIPPDSMYLAQTPPTGKTPKKFVLPVSPQSFYGERIAISNDGKEIYYTVIRRYYPTAGDTIKCYKYSGNKWTGPFNVFENYLAPAFSRNCDTIYFQNNNVPYEMLYSVRSGSNWTTPKRFLYGLNSAHYFQVTNSGNYYISSISNPTIGASDWCRLYMNGSDTTVVSLGLPVSSPEDNLDFFIARDESFMILAKGRLKITFKKSNGGWTNPKDLGNEINFGQGMWGPFVSSDNKYLFYTTGTNPNYSDVAVYWSRIDGLMDSLKHTNFAPYLKNQIPNLTDTVGRQFNFTVPDSTFIDDDGLNTLTFSATLSNGSPLPSWLSFNPATRTFSGTPASIGTVGLRVLAVDSANILVSCYFFLNVVNNTYIHEPNGQIINDYKLFQNFPNPFNPSTVISYSLPYNSNVSLKLYDVAGKEIAVLVNSNLKSGLYDVNLDISKLNLTSGIYFYSLIASELNSNRVHRETKAMNYIK